MKGNKGAGEWVPAYQPREGVIAGGSSSLHWVTPVDATWNTEEMSPLNTAQIAEFMSSINDYFCFKPLNFGMVWPEHPPTWTNINQNQM